MKKGEQKDVVIIGAGPAGLTAGLELARTKSFSVTVLERDSVVGGIAKTVEYKGCRFDIGPHHFITESEKILQWWQAIMEGDFHKHKRFTRIHYRKRFFYYPLEPMNALFGLGFYECTLSILSYLRYRLFPIKKVVSFQDWVTNRFGYRLFTHFFKTYTEKVWGISCTELSADWAAQRIKTFSLSKAIFYAFFGRFFKKNKPRTIRDDFYYPSFGSGALWERVAGKIIEHDDTEFKLSHEVVHIEHDHQSIVAVSTKKNKQIKEHAAQALTRYHADYFLSTMPLRALILAMDPLPPTMIVQAARALRYRGLITINLIVNNPKINPDHWLYVHDKELHAGRVGNSNNFSPYMVDDPTKHSAISLECFCYTEDPFWYTSDKELLAIGKQELSYLGFAKPEDVLDGMILRTPEAYPVYDAHYQEHLTTVLQYLARFSNLQLMGRNGLHQYNNMDIAMLSALAAVDKVLEHEKKPHERVKASESVFLT